MSLDQQAAREAFDLVLVGGGLQNGLIALKTLHTHPGARIALVEAEARLGGNHTWCVHAGDVPPGARAWFEPLIVQLFSGYDVAFPNFQRSLESSYSVISSARFDSVLQACFAAHPHCALFTH